ncbi:hypothetical protein WICMUC_004852 [Wickerhamomyces mucosus]|uniref:Endonuclease/exonuclease/phosphatase domain-containing protein n=1 Tax=Wickerhamomyces mucosus TaxID=1378264 RepID=A0A9P8T9T3_9ASCO|nr:hypothetical protein WICMUC_004852 [Wickerhamomyces mucosus]
MNKLVSPKIDPLNHRKWIQMMDQSNQNYLNPYRKIKVMSYNILNQSYIWPQIYNEYVSPLHQSRNYRLNLLKQTINKLSSDIMCFQEMENKSYREIWKNYLYPKFGSEFIKKDKPIYWNDNTNNSINDEDLIDGVSIFYDLNKFELIDKESFNIKDYQFINDYNKSQNFLNVSEINDRFINRNQVVLILLLRHKLTDEIILVLNTHLYWKYDDIKLLQTIIITKSLANWKLKYPNCKILLMGDFNSTPNSSVYSYLKFGMISSMNKDIKPYIQPSNNLDQLNPIFFLQNPIDLNSNILQDEINLKSNGIFTCYTKKLYGIFDYIWYNSKDFKLYKKLSGIDENYLKDIQGFPNDEFPSDHIPLVAEFLIST